MGLFFSTVGFFSCQKVSLVRKCHLCLVQTPSRSSVNVIVVSPILLFRAAPPSSFHASELETSLVIVLWGIPASGHTLTSPCTCRVNSTLVSFESGWPWGWASRGSSRWPEDTFGYVEDIRSMEINYRSGFSTLTKTRVYCKGEGRAFLFKTWWYHELSLFF